MPGPVPGIHVFLVQDVKTWMAGLRRAEGLRPRRRDKPGHDDTE
jgi:hypothetical protein